MKFKFYTYFNLIEIFRFRNIFSKNNKLRFIHVYNMRSSFCSEEEQFANYVRAKTRARMHARMHARTHACTQQ